MPHTKFIGVVLFDFIDSFKTDEDCKQYLSAIKWTNGYQCKKCGNANYCRAGVLSQEDALSASMMKVR